MVENIVKSNYKLAEKSVARYLEENPLTMEELNDENLVKDILLVINGYNNANFIYCNHVPLCNGHNLNSWYNNFLLHKGM